VGDEGIADVGARAAFVVDDNLLTPDLGELFSDDPRVDVCRSARSNRYDHVNGSIWPRTCPRRANEAQHDYRCSS